jgi:hypothetical protein
MYVEKVNVHYHFGYHCLRLGHLHDYYDFSFYYLISLFANHHPINKKIAIKKNLKLEFSLLRNRLLLFLKLSHAYYNHIHERQVQLNQDQYPYILLESKK